MPHKIFVLCCFKDKQQNEIQHWGQGEIAKPIRWILKDIKRRSMRAGILKTIIVLFLFTGLFADSDRPSNIPKDWPEECVPEFCKKPGYGECNNRQSKCHKINQKYDGYRPYTKDQNIWIVTPTFAKIFGMEDEYISTDLTGVEAIAYRVEDTYTECGFGGDADACMKNTRGILEVYIDEKKTPLPWVHPEQMTDRHASYDSTWLLRTDKSRDDYPFTDGSKVVINKLTNGDYRLRPFADPQTKHEAAYFQDLHDKDDWQAIVSILSYKRNAIDGLTVVSFFYQIKA